MPSALVGAGSAPRSCDHSIPIKPRPGMPPLGSCRNQPRSHRILQAIVDSDGELRVVVDAAIVILRLPDLAAALQTPCDLVCREALHRPQQRGPGAAERVGDEMQMIGHDHGDMEPQPMLRVQPLQRFEHDGRGDWIREQGLAIRAAGGDQAHAGRSMQPQPMAAPCNASVHRCRVAAPRRRVPGWRPGSTGEISQERRGTEHWGEFIAGQSPLPQEPQTISAWLLWELHRGAAPAPTKAANNIGLASVGAPSRGGARSHKSRKQYRLGFCGSSIAGQSPLPQSRRHSGFALVGAGSAPRCCWVRLCLATSDC